jgi:hypothetical protein
MIVKLKDIRLLQVEEGRIGTKNCSDGINNIRHITGTTFLPVIDLISSLFSLSPMHVV